MALSSNQYREFEGGMYNELPVKGSTTVYEGSACGDDGSGYARPLSAGDPFRGFAQDKVDNSAGSDGDKRVRLRREGVVKLDVANVTGVNDVGKQVYASDDDTFTLTAGSNTPMGRIVRHISGTTCMVAYDAEDPNADDTVYNPADTSDWASTPGSVKEGLDTLAARPRVRTIEETVAYGDFTDNGDATGYIDLGTDLPANAIPLATKFEVSTAFDSGDTSSATAQAGVSGDLDRFTEQSTLDVNSTGTVGSTPPADTLAGIGSAQTPRVTVTEDSDFGQITQGEMTVTLYYIEP